MSQGCKRGAESEKMKRGRDHWARGRVEPFRNLKLESGMRRCSVLCRSQFGKYKPVKGSAKDSMSGSVQVVMRCTQVSQQGPSSWRIIRPTIGQCHLQWRVPPRL